MRILSRQGPAATFGLVVAALLIGTQMEAYAASGGGHKPTALHFGTPVRLPTFRSCGGDEPGLALDRFGNIFVTAHRQNHCNAVALDPSAPAGVRAQSWRWTSIDGVNFTDLPGLANLPADPGSLDVGDEGDLALDDANHLYFVDTNVADASFARWSVTGAGTGNMTEDIDRPQGSPPRSPRRPQPAALNPRPAGCWR